MINKMHGNDDDGLIKCGISSLYNLRMVTREIRPHVVAVKIRLIDTTFILFAAAIYLYFHKDNKIVEVIVGISWVAYMFNLVALLVLQKFRKFDRWLCKRLSN